MSEYSSAKGGLHEKYFQKTHNLLEHMLLGLYRLDLRAD